MLFKSKNFNIIILLLMTVFTYFVLYYFSSINYTLIHTIIELTVAVVAITIFSIGWNTREFSKNNFLIILSIGYFCVGILTVLHALSNKRMVFLPGHSTNMATQFWISARLLEGFTILLATLLINKKKVVNPKITISIFLSISILVMLSIFYGFFPVGFIDGKGLTTFKVISEYLVCLLLLISGFMIWKRRRYFDSEVINSILIAFLLKIVSEFCFTLYIDVNGLINFLGHYFMFISLYFIYIALIKSSLTRPYKMMFNNIENYIQELALKNKDLLVKDMAIESALIPIVFMDTNGTITYVNTSFVELLGYSNKEEVLNQEGAYFLYNPIRVNNIKESLLEKNEWKDEIVIKKKNNSILETFMTINYIYSREDTPICLMVSFQDITERKKVMRSLIRAKVEADAANGAKSKFLANMSHEIRTPMNGILGYIELLENSEINEDQMDYINNIKASTDTLLTVINDILDISKIEAGKLELETISFNLHETLHHSVIPFTAKAKQKGLELVTEIGSDVPRYAFGDPVRLKQVISNLISNAIKFTHNGHVALVVDLLDTKEDVHTISISVKDTGIGMNEEAVKKIFDDFTQAEISSNRKYGGTGLGLAISKSIVELMGGNIQVESTEGEGTIFTVTLDMKEDLSIINPVTLSQEDIEVTYKLNDTLKRMKILLVEDNEVNRTLLTTLLEIHGMKCDIAVNGKEAVEAYFNNQYDIIFMDCQMPIMDGYEATQAIRLHEAGIKHTTIIAMTANAMKGDEEKCIECGMDDYISKPISAKHLLIMLTKYQCLN